MNYSQLSLNFVSLLAKLKSEFSLDFMYLESDINSGRPAFAIQPKNFSIYQILIDGMGSEAKH